MKTIEVKALMTKNIACLPAEAPLQMAIQQMVDQRYSCIVIKQNELPIGIVTERDMVKVLNQEKYAIDLTLPVADFMSAPILSLHQNESLFDALVFSRAERIRHLPVVDDHDQLVGLVTQSDLANAHFRVIEMQSEIIDQLVAVETDKLQKVNEELQMLSMEDHLMKIGNRRSMEVDLGHTHSASLRYATPYSILLFDIDFFKLYNDHYGHQAGDDALQKVASTLKSHIRESDRIYRYGGEELLVILPCTNELQALRVAKKLIYTISQQQIPHDKSSYNILTLSCGGACVLENGDMAASWKDLVARADNCLYMAKKQGRNQALVSAVESSTCA